MTGDYTNHMVFAVSIQARSGPLVTIDTGEDQAVDLQWLAQVQLPSGLQVQYGAVGSRVDFLLRRDGAEVAAVCDLASGEYVLSAGSGMENLREVTQILLELLSLRLRHLRAEPIASRRSREGSLKELAGLTCGTWFPFEALQAV